MSNEVSTVINGVLRDMFGMVQWSLNLKLINFDFIFKF
jgi:hypothetical protein